MMRANCPSQLVPSGPISEESPGKVCASLDEFKPSNVGFEHGTQSVRQWKGSVRCGNDRNGQNGCHRYPPPIKYLHLHESDRFSIGIFCMPPSAIIPLHNHPGMTGLSKLLYGSLLVKSYDWIDLPAPSDPTQANINTVLQRAFGSTYLVVIGGDLTDQFTCPADGLMACFVEHRPGKLVRDCEMTAPCGTTILYPTIGGNIHCFKALTPCALFDVLSPVLFRRREHCLYFRAIPTRALQGGNQVCGMNPSEVAWWEEIQPPKKFVVHRGVCNGPTIRR